MLNHTNLSDFTMEIHYQSVAVKQTIAIHSGTSKCIIARLWSHAAPFVYDNSKLSSVLSPTIKSAKLNSY